ncbi:MAG: tRNA (N6-threonylcarbamoyladenosine(37)-N6)-methyltransferase TrmO [Opitutales bacterium]
MEFNPVYQAIGHVESPYLDCFGVPRQPGLNELPALLRLHPPYDAEDWVRGLEAFSHLWVLWWFDRAQHVGPPSATVRPPRLGGNQRLGVFATRSPYRPNPIALSVVPVREIQRESRRILAIEVLGLDCADGTPLLDLKPYLPYCDAVSDAMGGFAPDPPVRLSLDWSEEARAALPWVARANGVSATEISSMIEGALANDPAPAYHQPSERIYWLALRVADIGFRRRAGHALTIEALRPAPSLKSRPGH